MSNRAKDILILVIVCIAALALIFAFNMGRELGKRKTDLDKEISFRFDMEQKVDSLSAEKLELIATLKNKDMEIQKLTGELEKANQAFDIQEDKIEGLQKNLLEMTLLKEKLEQNLKEELGKSRRR